MSAFLLEDQTTNTDGSQTTITIENTVNFAKFYTLIAYGTWDGATITVKFTPDNGTTWIACGDDTTFTADGAGNLYLNPSSEIKIRGDLTSAGASTSISLKVV